MINYKEYITIDPAIRFGKPTIIGTHIPYMMCKAGLPTVYQERLGNRKATADLFISPDEENKSATEEIKSVTDYTSNATETNK